MPTYNISQNRRNTVCVRASQKIGEGYYGQVFLAKLSGFQKVFKPQKEYVVKIKKNDYSPDVLSFEENHRDNIKAESRVLSTIPRHENIIKYKGCDEKEEVFMTEKAIETMTQFVKRVQSISSQKVKEKIVLTVAHDMLKAVSHLASNYVCHNDAHLNNWMFGRDGNIKLIDFGRATTKRYSGLVDTHAFRFGESKFYFDTHPLNAVQKLLSETIGDASGKCNQLKERIKEIYDIEQTVHEPEITSRDIVARDTECKNALDTLIQDNDLWKDTLNPSQMKLFFHNTNNKMKKYQSEIRSIAKQFGYEDSSPEANPEVFLSKLYDDYRQKKSNLSTDKVSLIESVFEKYLISEQN